MSTVQVDRPRSELIAASGRIHEIIKVLVRAIEDEGGSEENLLQLLSSQHLSVITLELLGKLLTGKDWLIPLPPEGMRFTLRLNQQWPFQHDFKSLVEIGRYTRSKVRIEMPVLKADLTILFRGVEVVLRRFAFNLNEQEAQALGSMKLARHARLRREVEEQGFRLSSIAEFLVFGAQHPDMQRWVTVNFPHPQHHISLYSRGNHDRTLRMEEGASWGSSKPYECDILCLVVPLKK